MLKGTAIQATSHKPIRNWYSFKREACVLWRLSAFLINEQKIREQDKDFLNHSKLLARDLLLTREVLLQTLSTSFDLPKGRCWIFWQGLAVERA